MPAIPADDRPARLVSPLAVGGLIALGAAMAVPPRSAGALLAGLAVAALGAGSRSWKQDRVPSWIKGMAAAGLLFLGAWGLQRLWGPLDLSGGILASTDAFALRLGLTGAAFGLFCLAGRRPGRPEKVPGDRVAWIAVALLLGGAALCDRPLLGLPLLAAGGALAAVYADQRRLREGLALVGLVLMAVFAAAGVWETAYRLRLREYAGGELLARLSPPNRDEVAAVTAEIRDHFQGIDLERVVPRSPAGLERQDLAYALWKDSPLARHHSLSALVVQRDERAPVLLLLRHAADRSGRGRHRPRPLGGSRPAAVGEDFLISGAVAPALRRPALGDGPLLAAAAPRLRGARLAPPERGGRRAAQGRAGVAATEEIAQPALYALYTPDGRAALSPWEEDAAAPAPAAPVQRGGRPRGGGGARRPGRPAPGPAPRRRGGR